MRDSNPQVKAISGNSLVPRNVGVFLPKMFCNATVGFLHHAMPGFPKAISASLIGLLTLTVLSCVGKSPAPDCEGMRISKAKILYLGQKSVDEVRIRNLISSKPGSLYSADRLDSDIKSLWESGLVEDVRFFGTPCGGTVILTAEVTTRPICDSCFRIVGNSVFSDQKLAVVSGLIPLARSNTRITSKAIADACRNIEHLYQKNGYKDAKASHNYKAWPDDPRHPLLVVNIIEGKRTTP